MGCLNAGSLKVAERWAVLAVVISRQANDAESEQSPDWDSFRQKAASLIRINDRYASEALNSTGLLICSAEYSPSYIIEAHLMHLQSHLG